MFSSHMRICYGKWKINGISKDKSFAGKYILAICSMVMPVLEWVTIIPLIMLSVIWSQTISTNNPTQTMNATQNETKWNETKRNEIMKFCCTNCSTQAARQQVVKCEKSQRELIYLKKIHFNIRMTNTEWNRLQCDWIFYVQLFGAVGCCNYSYCLFSLCMSVRMVAYTTAPSPVTLYIHCNLLARWHRTILSRRFLRLLPLTLNQFVFYTIICMCWQRHVRFFLVWQILVCPIFAFYFIWATKIQTLAPRYNVNVCSAFNERWNPRVKHRVILVGFWNFSILLPLKIITRVTLLVAIQMGYKKPIENCAFCAINNNFYVNLELKKCSWHLNIFYCSSFLSFFLSIFCYQLNWWRFKYNFFFFFFW